MRDIKEIVEANKQAVKAGVPNAPTLGAERTITTRFTVRSRADGTVLATGLTEWEVGLRYNAYRGEVVVEAEA